MILKGLHTNSPSDRFPQNPVYRLVYRLENWGVYRLENRIASRLVYRLDIISPVPTWAVGNASPSYDSSIAALAAYPGSFSRPSRPE